LLLSSIIGQGNSCPYLIDRKTRENPPKKSDRVRRCGIVHCKWELMGDRQLHVDGWTVCRNLYRRLTRLIGTGRRHALSFCAFAGLIFNANTGSFLVANQQVSEIFELNSTNLLYAA